MMPRKNCGRLTGSAGTLLVALAAVLVAGCAPSATPVAEEESMPSEATQSPTDRVILVTGSTDGLGREVALSLAESGAHLIIHGRNEERGQEVVAEAESRGAASARFYRADLGSLEEVRTLAEAVLRDYNRLDVLVNNAGIGPSPDERLVSQDGHELRFAVNYLSHYLLTRMLLPRLVESAPARIVNVASGAQTPLDFDDVMLESGFNGSRAYAQSKLAQILFTVDLAEELEGTGVVVSALHPATYMDTEMVRRAGVAPRSTVEEGAEAVLNLVESPELVSGQFYNGLQPTRAAAQAYDAAARAQLHRISQELTGAPPRT